MAGKSKSGAAAVGIDEPVDGFAEVVEVAGEAGGRVVRHRVGARHVEHADPLVAVAELEDGGVFGDEVDPLAQGAQIHEEVLADHAHDLPDRIAGLELAFLGEAAQEGDVDGGIEAVDEGSLDPEPVGGGEGAPRVEPLGRLEPFAEGAGVLVETEVLEDEGERADRRVVGGELVVVEIPARGIVFAPTSTTRISGSSRSCGRDRAATPGGRGGR